MQGRRMPERKMPERKTMERSSSRPKSGKKISSFAFMVCLIVIAVVVVFYQYKRSDKSAVSTNAVSTEVDKLAAKDLEVAYPATPTEVLKLYGRINQCIYNTKVDDEDFNKLLTQLRTMYSSSLLQQNSFDEQKNTLQNEISDFMSSKRRIANYTVDKSSSVQYKEIDGNDCAYVQMAYFMSENSKYSKSFQDYVLVKEGKEWKILAFKKDENADKQKKQS